MPGSQLMEFWRNWRGIKLRCVLVEQIVLEGWSGEVCFRNQLDIWHGTLLDRQTEERPYSNLLAAPLS